MEVDFVGLTKRSTAVAEALADARSARNLLTRRIQAAAQDEREADRHRRRRKQATEQELRETLRCRIRIVVKDGDRPRIGKTTARKLYHRDQTYTRREIVKSTQRSQDGLTSIHFAFVARGFASTTTRRWRAGEAERAARYITRESGLEGGEAGWWCNVADDRTELTSFFRAVEAFERHDRVNANIYISEIISLPTELSEEKRRYAVGQICQFFEDRGLPYVAALHVPDAGGDERNFHCHILYSQRPVVRCGPFDWSFAVSKMADINTPAGIIARRKSAVLAINDALRLSGISKTYTHLSNKERGIKKAAEKKIGQKSTWLNRRLKAKEIYADTLIKDVAKIRRLRDFLAGTCDRLSRQYAVVSVNLQNKNRVIEASEELRVPEPADRLHQSGNQVVREVLRISERLLRLKSRVQQELLNVPTVVKLAMQDAERRKAGGAFRIERSTKLDLTTTQLAKIMSHLTNRLATQGSLVRTELSARLATKARLHTQTWDIVIRSGGLGAKSKSLEQSRSLHKIAKINESQVAASANVASIKEHTMRMLLAVTNVLDSKNQSIARRISELKANTTHIVRAEKLGAKQVRLKSHSQSVVSRRHTANLAVEGTLKARQIQIKSWINGLDMHLDMLRDNVESQGRVRDPANVCSPKPEDEKSTALAARWPHSGRSQGIVHLQELHMQLIEKLNANRLVIRKKADLYVLEGEPLSSGELRIAVSPAFQKYLKQRIVNKSILYDGGVGGARVEATSFGHVNAPSEPASKEYNVGRFQAYQKRRTTIKGLAFGSFRTFSGVGSMASLCDLRPLILDSGPSKGEGDLQSTSNHGFRLGPELDRTLREPPKSGLIAQAKAISTNPAAHATTVRRTDVRGKGPTKVDVSSLALHRKGPER